MLRKKFYIPIGVLILVICAIAFFALRSDMPNEPVKIYKVTTPAEKTETQTNTTSSDTANNSKSTQGGHFHADGTWHSEPHSEETAQEKFDREMREKMAQKDQKIAQLEAEIKVVKTKNAERTKNLSRITEKGKEIVTAFPDVLTITSEKFLAFSETEQEEFLIRSAEYDVAVEELKNIVASTPQWILDELEERQPGAIDEFMNLPYLSNLLPELSELQGRL